MSTKTRRTIMKTLVKSILWIAIIILGIVGIFELSEPHEVTKGFWLPENYSIANLVDGEFIQINYVSLSGTAVFVPLKDYMSRFSEHDSSIIITKAAKVYYLAKEDGTTYVSVTNPPPNNSSCKIESTTTPSLLTLTSPGLMKISYSRDLFFVWTIIPIWLLINLLICLKKHRLI